MAPDSCLSTIEAIPNMPEAPPRFKFRVRFAKTGDLRLVSHHDLMHVCERMFRRADLTLPVTQGFNPRPRMWFASALALGVAGQQEVLEFELTQTIAEDEVHTRLGRQAPPGLAILSVRAIDVRTSARVRRAIYRLALPEDIADLPERHAEFLARTEYWIERLRPNPRRVNIRPFVHELNVNDNQVEMALWITDNGAARPDEIVAALGLQKCLDDGAVIERTALELYDELPPGIEAPPLLRSAFVELNTNDRELPPERPTAIFDSPMSFDS